MKFKKLIKKKLKKVFGNNITCLYVVESKNGHKYVTTRRGAFSRDVYSIDKKITPLKNYDSESTTQEDANMTMPNDDLKQNKLELEKSLFNRKPLGRPLYNEGIIGDSFDSFIEAIKNHPIPGMYVIKFIRITDDREYTNFAHIGIITGIGTEPMLVLLDNNDALFGHPLNNVIVNGVGYDFDNGLVFESEKPLILDNDVIDKLRGMYELDTSNEAPFAAVNMMYFIPNLTWLNIKYKAPDMDNN